MTETQNGHEVGYVFVDIVAFTKKYSSRFKQLEAIETMNNQILKIIDSVKEQFNISLRHTFLPTGDGVCICFDPMVSAECSWFICKVGETIATTLKGSIPVRVGVNQGEDLELLDIRGERNFVGAGINDCSRIMGFATPNQYLVGERVIQSLLQSPTTQGKFCGRTIRFVAEDKHKKQIVFHTFDGAEPPDVLRERAERQGFLRTFLWKSHLNEGVQTTAVKSCDQFFGVLKSKGVELTNDRSFVEMAVKLLDPRSFPSQSLIVQESLKSEVISGDGSFLAYELLVGKHCGGANPLELLDILSSFNKDVHFRPSEDCRFLINILISISFLLYENTKEARKHFDAALVFSRLQRGLNQFDLYAALSVLVLALKFREAWMATKYLDLMQKCKAVKDMTAYPFTFMYDKYYLSTVKLISGQPLNFALCSEDLTSTPVYSQLWSSLLGFLAKSDSHPDLVFLFDSIGKSVGKHNQPEYSDERKQWKALELRNRFELLDRRVFRRYCGPVAVDG